MANSDKKNHPEQLVLDFSTEAHMVRPSEASRVENPVVVHLVEHKARERMSSVRQILAKTGVFRMDEV